MDVVFGIMILGYIALEYSDIIPDRTLKYKPGYYILNDNRSDTVNERRHASNKPLLRPNKYSADSLTIAQPRGKIQAQNRDFTPNHKIYHRKLEDIKKEPYKEQHSVDVVAILRSHNQAKIRPKPRDWGSGYQK